MEAAIRNACIKRGWSARVRQPGLIEASITVRLHFARVAIPYDASSYSINYLHSHELDYNDGEIHRTYNRWVGDLAKAIDQELWRVSTVSHRPVL